MKSLSAFIMTALLTSAAAPALAQQADVQAQGQNQAQEVQRVRPITPADVDRLRGLLVEQGQAQMLTRDEYGALRDRTLDSQYALQRPGYSSGKGAPMPRRREIQVSATPENGAPNRIYMAQGIVSAVTFMDAKGRAWPIEDIAYDPQMLAVNGAGCADGGNGNNGGQSTPQTSENADRPHVLYVMPCKFWSWANIAVKLEGAPAPFIFQTESGSDQETAFVDMAVDIRVKGKAPKKAGNPQMLAAASDRKTPKSAAEMFEPDSSMDDFLNAVPPQGARQLRISGDDGADAWLYGGALYLKGPLVVMNPAHDARASSGAVTVWRFDRPVPRILARTTDGDERIISIDY